VQVLPVIFPELIIPVDILLLEVNALFFKSNWDWVTPLEKMLLLTSIVILVPAVNLSCFKTKFSWVILQPPLEEIILFSSIVIFVPAVNASCFPHSCVFLWK
jgi:hypothetical protein